MPTELSLNACTLSVHMQVLSWVICTLILSMHKPQLKGNMVACRAVQAQQWQEAIAKYNDAIAACADAPPVFAAVLHSNRAAAYQGLHQYADAVADSLRAKALDPSYAKVCAISAEYSVQQAVIASCNGKELLCCQVFDCPFWHHVPSLTACV